MQTLSLLAWTPLWKIPTHDAFKNNIIILESKDALSSSSISDMAKNCLQIKTSTSVCHPLTLNFTLRLSLRIL